MRNWMGDGGYRLCPLCEARNKAGHSTCAKCRTPLGSAPVVAARAQARPPSGSNPMMRMLLIGGLLLAIAAGLAVRGILNEGMDSSVLAEEQVRAAEQESVAEGPAMPPPEVTGWTPGGSAPAAAPVDTAPPVWSSSSFPVARFEAPSDPSTSMVGIAPEGPATSRVRQAVRQGHVFTNDDLLSTRTADTPAPAAAPVAEPPAPSPITERPAPRGDTMARMDGADGATSVAAAQRRVLAIRDRARTTGQDLDDEMEDAIDAVREAQKRERRDSE